MSCCTATVKKVVAFNVGGLLLVLGIVIVVLWSSLYHSLLTSELRLTNTSKSYEMWKETPIPMYLKVYMFNWTNSEEVLKDWKIPPQFEECGPYVFNEHHSRVNLRWNPNGTITYQQKRTWHFNEELSKGSLDDTIINLNVIAATIAHFVKDWKPIFKVPVNLALNGAEKSLTLKRQVHEWLFDGFNDTLLSIAKKFHISGLDKFDKFGWFYGRNLSAAYDGTYTMYTGENDLELLGIIEEWNGSSRTTFYDDQCGFVNGTSGELWPPVQQYDRVEIFSSDICSSMTLIANETKSFVGIEGKRYAATDLPFDDGSKYPEQKCFQGKSKLPSGTRDVSKCKFGAPAFVSYPHFYLADEWYRNNVVGMKPKASEHKFSITLEPVTGVPLNADAKMQINMFLEPVAGLSMFSNVKTVMMPMFWFAQTATLTEELSSQIKVLLILPSIGMYTGYGLISIGTLVVLMATYITFRGAWRDSETDHLLPEKAL